MKSVIAVLSLGLFFASTAMAFRAPFPTKKYYCGSLKHKDDSHGPAGAPTFTVVSSATGVTLVEMEGGAIKMPKTIALKISRSIPEAPVYRGGDYEVQMIIMKKTAVLSRISNPDWSAQCKLAVAK